MMAAAAPNTQNAEPRRRRARRRRLTDSMRCTRLKVIATYAKPLAVTRVPRQSVNHNSTPQYRTPKTSPQHCTPLTELTMTRPEPITVARPISCVSRADAWNAVPSRRRRAQILEPVRQRRWPREVHPARPSLYYGVGARYRLVRGGRLVRHSVVHRVSSLAGRRPGRRCVRHCFVGECVDEEGEEVGFR